MMVGRLRAPRCPFATPSRSLSSASLRLLYPSSRKHIYESSSSPLQAELENNTIGRTHILGNLRRFVEDVCIWDKLVKVFEDNIVDGNPCPLVFRTHSAGSIVGPKVLVLLYAFGFS